MKVLVLTVGVMDLLMALMMLAEMMEWKLVSMLVMMMKRRWASVLLVEKLVWKSVCLLVGQPLKVVTFVDGFDDEGFDEGAEVVEHGGSTRQEKGLILPLYKSNECVC